ncbi:virulence associated lipoprotein [Borrelia duttonii]|uniref:Uncharacterized conserved protein n=1 Tax=Borrelia duttonii (strain Ly) TaxID=412419 RepID=B5RN74_BORDL|nr:uncharacterized conserved protein [Borrelia duttonii Ly]
MKRKDFILFIMFVFILILLLLVSCGPKKYLVAKLFGLAKPVAPPDFVAPLNPVTFPKPVASPEPIAPPETFELEANDDAYYVDTDDEDTDDEDTPEQKIQKREEIKDIKNKIPSKVLKILNTHGRGTWDKEDQKLSFRVPSVEMVDRVNGVNGKQEIKYLLSTPHGLFYRLRYNDGSGSVPYTDKARRKEFYLALEYNDYYLIAFIYIYDRLSSNPAFSKETFLLRNNMVKRLRRYAVAYYIDVYQTLKAKEKKLDTLSLKNLRLLKTKLTELESSQKELIDKVILKLAADSNNFDTIVFKSIETTVRNLSFDNLWLYFKEKYESFASKYSVVMAHAKKIKVILNKIQ